MVEAGARPLSQQIFLLPNLITYARIALTPFCIWLLFFSQDHLLRTSDLSLRWLAALVFLAVMLSDAVDGYIARSRHLVSDLGKILDPIADKVVTGAAFLSLAALGELPWIVAVVILVREFAVTFHRLVAVRRTVRAAKMLGKLKTVAQTLALVCAILPLSLLFPAVFVPANTALMGVALLLTVVSGADYAYSVIVSKKIRKER